MARLGLARRGEESPVRLDTSPGSATGRGMAWRGGAWQGKVATTESVVWNVIQHQHRTMADRSLLWRKLAESAQLVELP